RVGILATISVLLWVIAASAIFFMGYVFFTSIIPKLEYYARRSPDWGDSVQVWTIISRYAVTIFLGSVATFLLAAISTVFLVITSRRATLRQINASLQKIMQELHGLRARAGPQ